MTLAPGSKQGSFTATFPDAPHAGEAGWKTHRLVLLLNRGSKKWERVFTETDSGTQSREAATARGDGQGVDITVTDGLSYDWNETAGVVRVAMTVMTIAIPDGAQAPTPQAQANGGGGGGCAASVFAPLALLLTVPLLLTGKRRS